MTTRSIAVFFTEGGLSDVGKHCAGRLLREHPDTEVRIVAADPDLVNGYVESTTRPISAEEFEKTKERAKVWKVDFHKGSLEGLRTACEEAVAGVSAVICAIGNRQPGKKREMARGTPLILDAMKKHSVTRMVLMSSTGVDDDWPPIRWSFAGKIFSCMFLTCAKSAYTDLTAQWDAVKSSGVDYFAVRPTGIDPAQKSEGQVSVLEKPWYKGGPWVELAVAKEDVAGLCIQEALNPTRRFAAHIVGGVPRNGKTFDDATTVVTGTPGQALE